MRVDDMLLRLPFPLSWNENQGGPIVYFSSNKRRSRFEKRRMCGAQTRHCQCHCNQGRPCCPWWFPSLIFLSLLFFHLFCDQQRRTRKRRRKREDFQSLCDEAVEPPPCCKSLSLSSGNFCRNASQVFHHLRSDGRVFFYSLFLLLLLAIFFLATVSILYWHEFPIQHLTYTVLRFNTGLIRASWILYGWTCNAYCSSQTWVNAFLDKVALHWQHHHSTSILQMRIWLITMAGYLCKSVVDRMSDLSFWRHSVYNLVWIINS